MNLGAIKREKSLQKELAASLNMTYIEEVHHFILQKVPNHTAGSYFFNVYDTNAKVYGNYANMLFGMTAEQMANDLAENLSRARRAYGNLYTTERDVAIGLTNMGRPELTLIDSDFGGAPSEVTTESVKSTLAGVGCRPGTRFLIARTQRGRHILINDFKGAESKTTERLMAVKAFFWDPGHIYYSRKIGCACLRLTETGSKGMGPSLITKGVLS
tara:strand:+ start:276 stop:920 length:645 start_codon:yes stop_codon:yes gene_type:complete